MALIDIIQDTFPANEDVGVPLLAQITILFDREMNETNLDERFFVEGPDTDQYVGPGLTLLEWPDNTSQGELDDFLKSPNYKGIVQGTTTFENISMTDATISGEIGDPYRTKLTFTATLPFSPLIEYTAMLSDALDTNGTTHSGIITFSFQIGSGSIETVPSTVSTSVLKSTLLSSTLTTATAMAVNASLPIYHAIEQSPNLRQIVVTFNQPIDPTTVNNDSVVVTTAVASDHPNITVTALGPIASTVAVSNYKLIISI